MPPFTSKWADPRRCHYAARFLCVEKSLSFVVSISARYLLIWQAGCRPRIVFDLYYFLCCIHGFSSAGSFKQQLALFRGGRRRPPTGVKWQKQLRTSDLWTLRRKTNVAATCSWAKEVAQVAARASWPATAGRRQKKTVFQGMTGVLSKGNNIELVHLVKTVHVGRARIHPAEGVRMGFRVGSSRVIERKHRFRCDCEGGRDQGGRDASSGGGGRRKLEIDLR